VLVADMLSTLLVALTSFLGMGVILYGCAGDDAKGNFFSSISSFFNIRC
jgi:multicomponent K+:H+ antiporter subunit D